MLTTIIITLNTIKIRMTTGRKTQGIKITMQTASITIEHHRTAQ